MEVYGAAVLDLESVARKQVIEHRTRTVIDGREFEADLRKIEAILASVVKPGQAGPKQSNLPTAETVWKYIQETP